MRRNVRRDVSQEGFVRTKCLRRVSPDGCLDPEPLQRQNVFKNIRLLVCFFTKLRCVENMLMKAVVAVGHGSCCKQHKIFQQPFGEDLRGQSFCSCLVIGMFLLVGIFSSPAAHRSPAGCLSGWCEIIVPCVVFLLQRDRDWSMTTRIIYRRRGQ